METNGTRRGDGEEERVDHTTLQPVAHLGENRTRLREQRASRTADAHLLSAPTGDASRTTGAGVFLTGPSSEIAETPVTIGVDLGMMNTVGDLQGGTDVAERALGHTVTRMADAGN